MRCLLLPRFLFSLAAILPAAVWGTAASEVSLLASQTSVSGAADDSDFQAVILRYTRGDAWQFRVDVPVLFTETSYATAVTGLGAVDTGSFRKRAGSASAGILPGGDPAAGPTTQSQEDHRTGLGDVRLAASRRIRGGGATLFRLDAGFEIKLPTADEDDGLGTGEWDGRLGLSGEYRFWSSTLFGGLGWNHLGDPEWVELADVPDAYLGLESEPLAGGVILSGWLEGYPEAVDGAGSYSAVGAGVRTTGATRFQILLTVGVGESSGDYRILLGVSAGEPASPAGTRGVQR